jgi:hypothetical protein
MFFPAGIPFAALIALIAWSIREEAKRQRRDNDSKRT